jgi:hypothetical protein
MLNWFVEGEFEANLKSIAPTKNVKKKKKEKKKTLNIPCS